MITKEWLKEELDKIDDRIYWEIAGYGNIDHVVNVFNKYLETQVKTCNLLQVSNCARCKKLEFMIENGLGWKDIENDCKPSN